MSEEQEERVINKRLNELLDNEVPYSSAINELDKLEKLLHRSKQVELVK